jgi:hypothetical protein
MPAGVAPSYIRCRVASPRPLLRPLPTAPLPRSHLAHARGASHPLAGHQLQQLRQDGDIDAGAEAAQRRSWHPSSYPPSWRTSPRQGAPSRWSLTLAPNRSHLADALDTFSQDGTPACSSREPQVLNNRRVPASFLASAFDDHQTPDPSTESQQSHATKQSDPLQHST